MTDDVPTKTLTGSNEPHHPYRLVRYLVFYVVLGALGSIVAIAFCAALIFMLAAALSLVIPAHIWLIDRDDLYQSIFQALLWAAPVNFLLLPGNAFLLRNRLARDLSLPLVGAIGSAITLWAMMLVQHSTPLSQVAPAVSLLLMLAAVAGGISGLFYARALNELE